MATVRLRALHTIVVGVGRELAAGQVGDVDAHNAALLIDMGRAELVDGSDAATIGAAVKAHAAHLRAEAAREASLFRAPR